MIIINGIENTTNPPANSNGIVFKRNIFDNISLLTTIICIKHVINIENIKNLLFCPDILNAEILSLLQLKI